MSFRSTRTATSTARTLAMPCSKKCSSYAGRVTLSSIQSASVRPYWGGRRTNMADTRNLSNKDKIGIQLDMVTNVLAYALSYRDSYDQDTPEWFGCAMTVHWLPCRAE